MNIQLTTGQWTSIICLSLLILMGFICLFMRSKRKAGITIFRIIVGVLFIFSGFVKADDPLGFAYKLKEYGEPGNLNMAWLDKFSFPIAFTIPIIEMTLGFMILLGAKRVLTMILIVLMMLFFTFLTWYTAQYGKVLECGCFGDAIPMTSWQSFIKNIILMVFVIILVFGIKHISPVIKGKAQNILILIFLAASTGFSWYCYNYLPVLDFRPYKVGTDIKKAMKGVPGIDKYYYTYQNKKTDEKREFENAPADTTIWKYVSFRTKTIKKGIDPVDFNISSLSGNDVADSILSVPGYNFLLISRRINESEKDPDVIRKLNTLADECFKHHIGFICLTNSGEDDISVYQKQFSPPYLFFNTDEIVLKTMIRSNPGLILIKGGVVKAMWHYHTIPAWGSRSLDSVTHDTIYHHVMNFKLTDQMGQTVTLDTFKNKIFAANFFFASCPGICKKMNGEIQRVAKQFAGNPNVKFISFSVTPEQDSVPVLAAYAKLHDAVPYQWYFLTGDKQQILDQAKLSFNLEFDKNLVHSQNITLIDTRGHIRGVYCGILPAEMDRMTKDIKLLLNE